MKYETGERVVKIGFATVLVMSVLLLIGLTVLLWMAVGWVSAPFVGLVVFLGVLGSVFSLIGLLAAVKIWMLLNGE